MNRIIATLALSIVAMFSTAAHAVSGTISDARINFIYVYSDGVYKIAFDQFESPWASCASGGNQSYFMAGTVNTTAGKTQLSTMLMAYATGKTVQIAGTSFCTLRTGIEDISYTRLNP